MNGNPYKEYGAAGAILLAAVMLFYTPLLSVATISPGSDMTNLFYPMKAFGYEWLKQGLIAFWNPYTFCGSPFFATYQPALLYPLDFVLGQLISPELAFVLYRFVHLWLFGFGMFVLLKNGFSRSFMAALSGALVAPFCFFTINHLEHINQLASFCWLPFLILIVLNMFQHPRSIHIALLALVLGMQLLAGHPQYSGYFMFLAVLYAIWSIAFSQRAHLRKTLKSVAFLAAGVSLGIALSAAQTIPSSELSRHSYRIFNDFGYASAYSMHPKYLLLYLNPSWYGNYARGGYTTSDNVGEMGCYLGILPLVFAFAGGVIAFRRQGKERFFVVMGILALLLAFGKYTPVFHFFYTVFPPFHNFRVPPRILSLVSVCAIILCAVGIDAFLKWNFFRSHKEGSKWRIVFIAGIPVLLFLDLFLSSRSDIFNFPVGLRTVDPTQDFAAAAFRNMSGLFSDSSDHRVFRLMIHDADAYGNSSELGTVARNLRIQPNQNMTMLKQTLGGYEEGLNPTVRYKDFTMHFNRNVRQRTPDTHLLTLLNVKYIYTELPIESERLKRVGYTHDPITDTRYDVYQNLLWRGGAFPAKAVEAHVDLDALDGTYVKTGIPQGTYGTIERPYLRTGKWFSSTEETDLPMTRPTPNTIHIRTPASFSDNLILSQATYPGWFKVEESTRRPVSILNAVMSHIPVESDETTITLKFEPFSFRLGLFISLWAGMIIIILFFIREHRKQPRETSPDHAPTSKTSYTIPLSPRQLHILLLAGIVLLCAYLRLFHLGSNPLWYTDESNFIDSAYNLAGGEARMQAIRYPFATEMHPHPPLFFFLNGVVLRLLGKEMFAARFLSALLATGAIIPIFLIGARLADKRVGLLAALLFAIHFYSLLFTRWGMPYNLCMFFNILALERISKAHVAHNPRALLIAALWVGLACVSSFYALPLVAVLALFALCKYRRYLLHVLAISLAPFIIFLLWGLSLRGAGFIEDFLGLFIQITPGGISGSEQVGRFFSAALSFLHYDYFYLIGIVGLLFWRGKGRIILIWLACLIMLILKKQDLDPTVKYNAPVYLYCIHLGAAWVLVRIYDNLIDLSGIKKTSGTSQGSGEQNSALPPCCSYIRTFLWCLLALPVIYFSLKSIVQVATTIHSDYDKAYGSVSNISDARLMADYVNSIVEPEDIVIAPERCYWLLNCRTANMYQAVASAGLPTKWHENIEPERFAYDCALDNAALVILDATDTGLILRSGNPNMDIIPKTLIEQKWQMSKAFGEYQVFKNPNVTQKRHL